MSQYNEPWWIEPYLPNEERAEIHYGERTTHPTDDFVTSPVVVALKVLPTIEYAERIVAAVNACRGIPTDELLKIAAWKDTAKDNACAEAATMLSEFGWTVTSPDGAVWEPD